MPFVAINGFDLCNMVFVVRKTNSYPVRSSFIDCYFIHGSLTIGEVRSNFPLFFIDLKVKSVKVIPGL